VIKFEDALLVLGGLSGKRVLCAMRTASVEVWAKGKMSLNGNKIFLESPDLNLSFALSGDFAFEYADPKQFFGSNFDGDAISALAIALPLRVPFPLPNEPPPRDKIIFLEIGE
jgi:hypothetical protein